MHSILVIIIFLLVSNCLHLPTICKIILLDIDYRITFFSSSSFYTFKMSLYFLLACIVFDEKAIIQNFYLVSVFKICPHLQFQHFIICPVVFLFVYTLFWVLSTSWIYSFLSFIHFGKFSGISSNIFLCLFLFLFHFQDLNYPYARPFDITQQLSHALLFLFVFSVLFFGFFLSFPLHFILDDF